MNSEIITKEMIKTIGKEAFERLSNLNVPPYPKYYHDIFMDFLYSQYNLNSQNINDIYQYLCINSNDEALNEKCIDITNKSLLRTNQIIQNLKELSQKTESISAKDYILKEALSLQESYKNLLQEFEKIQEQAQIDPITKSYKYKIFISDMEKILSFGKEKQIDLHLCLLNITNFIDISNKHGIIATDKALIYLISVLKDALRIGTRVYSYKNGMLAIIFNRADYQMALNSTKRILKEAASTDLFYKGDNIKLELSYGLSSHMVGDSITDIINRATENLKNTENL